MIDLLCSRSLPLTLLLLASIITGCVSDKKDGDNSDGSQQLDLEISASTNSRGVASISFKTLENVSKMTISAESRRNQGLRISKLTVGGQDYLSPRGETVSLANDFAPVISTTTVPSRSTDIPLNSPQEVAVTAEIENSRNSSGEEILFKITSRADKNLNSGNLNLNIFYVGTVGQEASTKAAFKSAIKVASDIFNKAAGISLTIKETDIGGPVVLPLPTDGNRIYETNSRAASSPAVNVFVSGDIDEIGSGGDVLGVSSSIPGPPTPSSKSAVAISVFSSAGSDGFFDSEDIRILGETIAHESAHYMGLFHPVDFVGSVVAVSDPLSDTEECSFITECVRKENLTTNLMFPNPVEDGRGGFRPQNNLTSQQRGVLNRYAAVD